MLLARGNAGGWARRSGEPGVRGDMGGSLASVCRCCRGEGKGREGGGGGGLREGRRRGLRFMNRDEKYLEHGGDISGLENGSGATAA